ncbi:orf1a polyprotein [Xenorhabdus sp. KJ12.1]|nr:orf1a polyprotein [Xenorhabdus sp. KJ12.1]
MAISPKLLLKRLLTRRIALCWGGGGVDGAIHRAGGKAILEECMQIRAKQGGCDIGDAVITGAGNLPAKYVIHTVGPCWNGGTDNEPELLKKAYVSCFDLIEQYNIETVSFPNISTGIYRFPKKLAAEIALEVIHSRLFDNQNILQVNLICFDDENYDIYRSLN